MGETTERQPQLALKLWVVLSRAHAEIARRLQADVARHGLTASEFGALEALFHKGPLLLGEVAKKALVTSGGTTILVDRLERKGLVERRRCPEDRRAVYAALTPDGEELMRRIFPEHAAAVAEALSGLSDEEQGRAVELLKALGKGAMGVRSGSASKRPGAGADAGAGAATTT